MHHNLERFALAHPEFIRPGLDQALAHVTEEMGEVLAAVGKTQRFGPHSVNPTLPPEQQETNSVWCRREIADLRGALDRLEQELPE